MPNAPIDVSKMKVGAKGGGKHWTKAEIRARALATATLTPKTAPNPKPPPRLKPPPGSVPAVVRRYKQFSSAVRKVWNKTTEAMAEHGLLENADEDVLANYCIAVVREEECNRAIQEFGYISFTEAGETLSSYVKAQQAYSRLVLQYAEKLGLTPAARARIAKRMADGKKDEDKNAELFA